MPAWALQAAAIGLAVVALVFFAFAGAYYVRNRRMALAARAAPPVEDGPGVGGPVGADRVVSGGTGGGAGGSETSKSAPDVKSSPVETRAKERS